MLELKQTVISAIQERQPDEVRDGLRQLQDEQLFFPPDDWGMLAEEAGISKSGTILEHVWGAAQKTKVLLGPWDYSRFAFGAIATENAVVLRQVLGSLAGQGLFWHADVWSRLATAAADKKSSSALDLLWDGTGASRNRFPISVLAQFAEAAAAAGNSHVLAEVMDAVYTVGYFNPDQWRRLIDIAISGTSGDVARCLWLKSIPSRTNLWSVVYGLFGSLASAVKDANMLEEVFDAWTPSPDTLGGEYPEHATWAAFFKAAEELGEEGLLFKFFCKLETFYDPVRYRRRGINGSLQNQLKDIRSRMKNRALADEIAAITHGDRWELHRFFLTLNAYPPSSDITATAGRFEGAARCLMQWLINRFFTETPAAFETALGRVVDGITALPRNQAAAWFSLLCRGQQNYGGNIAARYRSFFQQHLSFVEGLSGPELLAKLKDGTLTDAVGKFELSCKTVAPWPDNEPCVPPESRAANLLPAIETIAENCANAVHYVQEEEKSDLWVKLKSYCDSARIEAFERADWMLFLSRLLWVVSWRVAQAMELYLGIQVHGLKNRFLEEYQKPLEELAEEERLELATYARSFLLNAHQRLQRRGKGDAVPVKLTSLVERSFVTGGSAFLGTVFAKPKDGVWISAWEGAKRDIVEHLLQELAFNCSKALAAVPPMHRFLRISVETDDATKLASLVVLNPIPESPNRNPHSTKMGQRYVRRLAGVLLGDPNKEDAATFKSQFEESLGREIFITRVIFPLSAPPLLGAVGTDE